MTLKISDIDFTQDAFLDGTLVLKQPKKGFRAGSDTVFLARAFEYPQNAHILDVGCGAGGAGLIAAKLNPNISVTGLEKQDFYADIADENALYNKLNHRFKCIRGDILLATDIFRADSFTHIITNPPFFSPKTARPPEDEGRKLAHHESIDPIIWLRKCLSVLQNGGVMTVIFRAERLHILLEAVEGRAGDIHIFPLFPTHNTPAKRILFKCRKASKSPMKILSGLVLHDGIEHYSVRAAEILKGYRTLGM